MFIHRMYPLLYVLQFININQIDTAVPVFSNIPVPIHVREDVTSETLLDSFNVSDPDGGAVTSCSHTGDSGEFDIRQDTTYATLFDLYVLAGANIEYDNSSSFTLVVVCTDGQSESASENIQIDVIPNQPPTITAAPSPISVSENVDTQKLLYTLTVSDAENDPFYCDVKSTSPASSKFDIWWDSASAGYQLHLLSSPGLSYSTTPMYTVTAECWDNYGTSTSDVVVFILPNAAPTITNLPADQTKDASSTSMGTIVYTVSAMDIDSSSLTYTMRSYPITPDLFAINAVTGEIKTTNDLTFAVDSAYLLTVTVSDTKSTTSEDLRILLSNVNTAPTINNLPADVYVDEDVDSYSVLYNVDENDPDVGDSVTLTFTVWPAAYASKIYMFQGTRVRVQSQENFDYEDQNYFEISFTASDGKATSGPYILTVRINDVPEECIFSASAYYVTMYEGVASTVTADPGFIVTDEDIADTYTLSIDYSASLNSTYFSIDGTSGIITFATNYDVDASHPTEVNLTTVCTDSAGKTGTTTVLVTVFDVNDNAPQFSKSGYISYIDQNDSPTTTVKQMNMFCSDADSGNNADIEYSWSEITGGSSNYFHMSTSGKIILLTYPAITMTYGDIHSFTIIGTDQGTPPLSDTTRLDIIYRESNSSTNLFIPTTTATAATTASNTSVETTPTSASFWDEPVNIMVVVLAAVLGVILAGLIGYLCWKGCKKLKHKRTQGLRQRGQRKVEPKPNQEKTPFDFWGQNNNDLGYMHNAVPAPSS